MSIKLVKLPWKCEKWTNVKHCVNRLWGMSQFVLCPNFRKYFQREMSQIGAYRHMHIKA